MHVMIYVTHLLGSGHLARALTLARAFTAAGDRATVVSGGVPVPVLETTGIDLVQLPPVKSDGVDFTRLLTGDGAPADAAYLAARQDMAVDLVRKPRPDAVLTELFPFGRRILRDEFRAILMAAHEATPHPVILASVRDILNPPSKPAKAAWALEVVLTLYDGVLVHSDPTVTQLSDSWPTHPELTPELIYTGYVAPDFAPPSTAAEGEVLVSAGGGSVGDSLYQTALGAAALDPTRRWRLLIGGADRSTRIAAFERQAGENVVLEPTRPDYRSLLTRAAASVSFCGYNTAMDLLQTGVPAVIVPFDEGGEQEQSLRAKGLSNGTERRCIPSAELTPVRLASEVNQVIAAGRGTSDSLNFDGAATTQQIVARLVAERQQ